MKKISLIGAGLIGKERLNGIKCLQESGKEIKLLGIFDPYCKDIENIAAKHHTSIFKSIKEVVNSDSDWLIVAIPHDIVTEIIPEILKSKSKILIEKPLGRSVKEAKQILSHVSYSDQLWIGFNYRFFEGITALLADLKRNRFGELVSVNFILGHGCNPDIEKSWKLDPRRAGGGCLIDPGIHLLDLCRIISNNNLEVINGIAWDGFWNTGIEEECHLMLKSKKTIYNLQISIVHWKSTFTIEANGTEGYGRISGRNRSYGNQTYTIGKRWGWLSGKDQKDTEELIINTDGSNVFAREMDALFFGTTHLQIKPCSAEEALLNMQLLEECLNAIKSNSFSRR